MDQSSTKWTCAKKSHLGVDPKSLVGKVLRRSKRSSTHPSLTLDFADNTSFQLRVDGYDPKHKGLPKLISIDDPFASPIDQLPNSSVRDCLLLTLSDKAFQLDSTVTDSGKAQWWDQDHTVLALKFDRGSWHTVSVRMQDKQRECTFRSYADVYLEQLPPSPGKKRRPSYL